MRRHLLTPVLLAAILALAGWREFAQARTSRMAGPAAGPQTAVAGTTAVRNAHSAVTSLMAGRTLAPASAPRMGTLAGDDAVLVAEMSSLQLLALGTNLALTPAQWSALANVTLQTQTLRQAYEAQIARGAAVAPRRYRVEIPMYAAAGDVLRAQFHASLQTELGAVVAADVLAKIGGKLEGHFGGFGVAEQTLEIVGDPRGAEADCEVTRTVNYWNSVEGGERLTTRRETHFPAWEDPTGESWGPLLAVVGA